MTNATNCSDQEWQEYKKQTGYRDFDDAIAEGKKRFLELPKKKQFMAYEYFALLFTSEKRSLNREEMDRVITLGQFMGEHGIESFHMDNDPYECRASPHS